MRRLFIATALLLFACGCPVNTVTPVPEPEPAPVPVVTVSDLDAEMDALVVDLVPVENAELSEFYSDFADVVIRDAKFIRNTGDILASHTRAGNLCFQGTDIVEKTPGVGAKVNKAVADALGLQNRELTDDRRARAVAIFKAISRAVQ